MEKLEPESGHATLPLCANRASFQRMRPSTLVRTLNAAGFGNVISERQLYRYRSRAGDQIGDGRTVDLLRFVAWIVTQRHSRFPLPKSSNNNSSSTAKTVTAAEVENLLQRQNFHCALTGYELEPANAAMDHILAVSRGGTHTIDNAQILRKDVNRAKGTLTNDEFIALCRAVVDYADRTSPL
jgi:5-methylcytosine-specific restriction endonuclease McrA